MCTDKDTVIQLLGNGPYLVLFKETISDKATTHKPEKVPQINFPLRIMEDFDYINHCIPEDGSGWLLLPCKNNFHM